MDMGTMSEAVCPALIPWNPAAETPTIVNGKPLTRTVCPTTPGFEPKRDCQNEWLNTAIQRQVAGNMVIETGYNANVGTHLQTGLLNFNQVPTAAYQALVARLFRRPRVGLGSLAPSFISNRTRRSLCPVPNLTR